MTWLLIIGVMGLAISPLLWMRSSPRQKHLESLRRYARTQGVQVILHKRPEARDSETRLEAMCYRLPWRDVSVPQDWVLHRYSQRGWAAPIEGWFWFRGEPSIDSEELLAEFVCELPDSATAIICSAAGIGLIWRELESLETLERLCALLVKLRKAIEKKHPNT